MAQTAKRRPVVTDGAQGVDQFCNIDRRITATNPTPQVGALHAELTASNMATAVGLTVRRDAHCLGAWDAEDGRA